MSAFFHAAGLSNFNTIVVELHCNCNKQQPTFIIMESEFLTLQGFAGVQVFQSSILLNFLGPQNAASWFFGQDAFQDGTISWRFLNPCQPRPLTRPKPPGTPKLFEFSIGIASLCLRQAFRAFFYEEFSKWNRFVV